MYYSPRVKEAMDTAIFCHLNQRDKGGYPYLAHPFHLAERCHAESETIVALLHDAFEDSTGASQRYIRGRLEECQATPEEREAIFSAEPESERKGAELHGLHPSVGFQSSGEKNQNPGLGAQSGRQESTDSRFPQGAV